MRYLLAALVLGTGTGDSQNKAAAPSAQLEYSVEWRLIEAGKAQLAWIPGEGASGDLKVHLESVGLVSKLYRLQHEYLAKLDPGGCTARTVQKAEERSRRRETQIVFDRTAKKANYVERDLVRGSEVKKEVATAGCALDVMGALVQLRRVPRLDPGTSFTLPVTDGKKFTQARVEVQAREKISTPAGEFNTVRLEAFLFDGALYQRKARLHIWLSEDADRLPVQVRVAMRFYVGAITARLEKKP